METPEKVAKWLAGKYQNEKELRHEEVVWLVRKKFGPAFVNKHQDGKMSINYNVLKAFRKFTKNDSLMDKLITGLLNPAVLVAIITTLLGSLLIATLTNTVTKEISQRELEHSVLSSLMAFTNQAKFNDLSEIDKLAALITLVEANQQFKIELVEFKQIVAKHREQNLERFEELKFKIKNLNDKKDQNKNFSEKDQEDLEKMEKEFKEIKEGLGPTLIKVSGLEKDIALKDENITNLKKDITQKDETITNLKTDITEKDDTIANLETDITEKDEKITNLENDVNSKSLAIQAKENEISDKIRIINEKNDQIDAKDKMIKAKTDDITANDKQIKNMKTKIGSLEESIRNKDSEIEIISNELIKEKKLVESYEDKVKGKQVEFEIKASNTAELGKTRIIFSNKSIQSSTDKELADATIQEFSFPSNKGEFRFNRKLRDLSFLEAKYVLITRDTPGNWKGEITIFVNDERRVCLKPDRTIDRDRPWDEKRVNLSCK